MAMAPSESYYSNYMIDKIYDMQLGGDNRSFEVIERELWAQSFNDRTKEIQELRALLVKAVGFLVNYHRGAMFEETRVWQFLSRPDVKAILEKEGR